MNSKTNYTLVGFFVLLSVVLITFFVVWLLQPTDEEQEQLYRIEFSESVSGLNVDSPVKYRGVTIGKVKSIRISPHNVEKIEVLISVRRSTPIKTDTVAKLKPQGITGLTYVNLSRGSRKAPLLRPKNRHDIPLIHSEPSFLVKIERTFGSASENLAATLVRLKTLLGEENQAQVQRILTHGANILQKLDDGLKPERLDHIDGMVVSITSLSNRIEKTLPYLERLAQSGDALAIRAKTSLTVIEKDFDRIGETMQVINERNKNGDYSVKENIQPAMMQFEMTMHELRQSLIMLNQMLQRYGDNPSDMLFQYQPPLVGPGEK